MLGPTLRQGARFGGTAARLVSGHRSAFPSSLAAYCSAFVRAFLLRPFRFVLAAAAAPPALERNTRSPCAQMLGASAVRAALACSSVRVLTVPDRFSANGTPSPAPPTRANLAGHFGELGRPGDGGGPSCSTLGSPAPGFSARALCSPRGSAWTCAARTNGASEDGPTCSGGAHSAERRTHCRSTRLVLAPSSTPSASSTGHEACCAA